jgi:hypothetical protein
MRITGHAKRMAGTNQVTAGALAIGWARRQGNLHAYGRLAGQVDGRGIMMMGDSKNAERIRKCGDDEHGPLHIDHWPCPGRPMPAPKHQAFFYNIFWLILVLNYGVVDIKSCKIVVYLFVSTLCLFADVLPNFSYSNHQRQTRAKPWQSLIKTHKTCPRTRPVQMPVLMTW